MGCPFLPPNGHSSFMLIACLPSCLVFWLHGKLGVKTGRPLASVWITPQSKRGVIVQPFLWLHTCLQALNHCVVSLKRPRYRQPSQRLKHLPKSSLFCDHPFPSHSVLK